MCNCAHIPERQVDAVDDDDDAVDDDDDGDDNIALSRNT